MKIFSCSQESLNKLSISDDSVSINNICYKKNDLNREVIKNIDSNTNFPDEIKNKFLNPITNSIL